MLNKNLVTVLMPVYNGEKYIKEAIDSILCQTFKNFEFLIINDGSTDSSVEIIKSYRDSRIRLLINEHNLGLIGTLNIGLKEARGKYIARMDQDDISMPERLERQIAYLDTQYEVGLLGTTFAIKSGEAIVSVAAVLLYDQDLRHQLLYKNSFCHGTVMFRRSLGTKLGELWYSSTAENAEDYELWSRIATITKIANLPELLYIWRANPSGISARRQILQRNKRLEIARRNQANPKLLLNETYISLLPTMYRNDKIILFGHHYTIRRANNYVGMLVQLTWIATKRLSFIAAFKYLGRIFSVIIASMLKSKTNE